MANDRNDNWHLSQKCMCFYPLGEPVGLKDNECQSPIHSNILVPCIFGQANQPGPSNKKQFDPSCSALPLFRKVMMFSQQLLSALMSSKSNFEESPLDTSLTSGPLHLPCPLPSMLFFFIPKQLAPSTASSLYLNVSFSMMPSLTTI